MEGTSDFVGTNKEHIVISRSGQSTPCKWTAVKCFLLMIFIMIIATAGICIIEYLNHEAKTWSPKFTPPILGPYSTPVCEQYVNKNYSSPLNDQIVTFDQGDDWTLSEIWVYQEEEKYNWTFTVSNAMQLHFSNGVRIPSDETIKSLPYFNATQSSTKITVDTTRKIKYISSLATCGLKLYSAEMDVLNDVELWNETWCKWEKAEWTPPIEIPDGSSIIGLILGMAELDKKKYSQMCAISYLLWETPPNEI